MKLQWTAAKSLPSINVVLSLFFFFTFLFFFHNPLIQISKSLIKWSLSCKVPFYVLNRRYFWENLLRELRRCRMQILDYEWLINVVYRWNLLRNYLIILFQKKERGTMMMWKHNRYFPTFLYDPNSESMPRAFHIISNLNVSENWTFPS